MAMYGARIKEPLDIAAEVTIKLTESHNYKRWNET